MTAVVPLVRARTHDRRARKLGHLVEHEHMAALLCLVEHDPMADFRISTGQLQKHFIHDLRQCLIQAT